MKNFKLGCECPNDCRIITYAVSISTSLMNERLLCPNNKGLFKEFQGPLGLPKMFFAYYNQIVNGVIKLF